MSDLIYFGVWGCILVFMCGLIIGGWLRDSAWRSKANGPSRMLCRGRFYQVLTSEAYEELIRDAR